MSTRDGVHTLLNPTSIAIIGASGDSAATAARPLETLRRHGYQGKVYLVNPNRDEIAGMATYKEVGAIQDEIDLALICVPSNLVAKAVEECGKKGVRTAYVLASGYEGAGSNGPDRVRELKEVLHRWPLRVAGPNGVGLLNVHDDIPVTFSRGANVTKAGNIAVVSQSGGLAFGIFEYGLIRGLGFSYVVSTGNEIDLEVADFLEYFLEDPRTKVVLLFVEGFRSAERISGLLPRYLKQGKSLIIAKMGNSEEAQLAIVSHTAHAAGQNELYNALFERYGVYQAADLPDMLDAAAALSRWDSIGGRGVGILTASGGAGVWAAEACVASGLEIPELEPERQKGILADLDYYAAARNPVDITASGTATFATVISTVAASPKVNALVLVGAGFPLLEPKSKANIRKVIESIGIPAVAYAHHPPSKEMLDAYSELLIPCYLSPVGAANGINALCQHSEAVASFADRGKTEMSQQDPVYLPEMTRPSVVLCEYEVKQWLRANAFPVPAGVLVQNVGEAAEAAQAIGYPVVVKVQAPSLSHKANVGGVALNIADEIELRSAYERILAAVENTLGDRELDGVLVERMARVGVEMMVGLKTEPELGAFVVIGAGGVLTETIDDKLIALAPLTQAEVARAITRLRCWPLLTGAAGHPALDVDAFCGLVSRLSFVGQEMIGVIRELDLNPVIVYPEGEGVEIVDGLAVSANSM